MIEKFHYVSPAQDPARGFAEYRRLYANGSDVIRGVGAFEAEIVGRRLENLLLFERRCNGAVHQRIDRIEDDQFSHIFAHVVLEGTLIGSELSGFAQAGPGEIVLLDGREPTRTEPRGCHFVTISLARQIFEAAISPGQSIHGLLINATDSALFVEFLRNLLGRIDTIPGGQVRAARRALLEMLLALIPGGQRFDRTLRSLELLRQEAIEAYIQDQIANSELSVASLVRDVGIPRSTLYRVVENQGGIARMIQRRRRDLFRRLIETTPAGTLSDLALKAGFADERHGSRVFARSYGMSPGAYRKMICEQNDPVEIAFRRWQSWMIELR